MTTLSVRWNGADVAKATGLAIAIILAVALVVSVVLLSDADFLTDTDILGVPVFALLLAGQQAVFVLAAWRFSVSKYGVDSRSLGFVKAAGRAPYLKAVGAWLVALAAIAIWAELMILFGWDTLELSDNAGDVLDFGGGIYLSILVVGLWGPVTEEIFFRSFALAGLRRRFGTLGAVVLSSALFALFHIDPSLYVPIFIFGMVLGWLYTQTHSIWPPIVSHALQNTTALLAAAAN